MHEQMPIPGGVPSAPLDQPSCRPCASVFYASLAMSPMDRLAMSPMDRLSRLVIGSLERLFRWWGRLVVRRPYPVILTCVAVTALASVGFLKFR